MLGVQLNGAVDRDLALEARQYQQAVAGARDVDDLRRRASAFLEQNSDAGHGFVAAYLILFGDGSSLTNTGDRELQTAMATARLVAGRPATAHDVRLGDIRVTSIPIEQGGVQVADLRIAVPLSGMQVAAAGVLATLLVGNAVLVTLGAVLANLVIGRALAPVQRISATAAGISEGDLSRRIGYRGADDEIGRLAQTIDAMLARLQHGFAQRQAFYALASHELRTPLTIVRGHLEVLRRAERPATEEVRETLDIALEELERITDQVNDMLLLGRMLLGQPGPLEAVDAATVMAGVHRRARRLAVRDWRLDVVGPVLVRADAEQLSRALLNLVTNAVRHTREGQLVRLACRAGGAWAELEVADAGRGIRAADLPHVFDPWYRAGRRDGEVGGLGLMIVREVARAHGGWVDVASRDGRGTTFVIRLPLDREGSGPGWRSSAPAGRQEPSAPPVAPLPASPA